MVPATTTEVRDGINKAERKNALAFVNFEFRKTARISGSGMRTSSVQNVYRLLFLSAAKKVSLHKFL
ncbi:hypothetical protein D3C86_1709060 [compost metagenome]